MKRASIEVSLADVMVAWKPGNTTVCTDPTTNALFTTSTLIAPAPQARVMVSTVGGADGGTLGRVTTGVVPGVVGRVVTGTLGIVGLLVLGAVEGVGLVVVGASVVVVSSLPVGRLTPPGETLLVGVDVTALVGVEGFGSDVGALLSPGFDGTVVESSGWVMTVTTTPSGVVTIDPSGVVTTAERGSRAMRSESRDPLWMTTAPIPTIATVAPRVAAMVRR